MWVRVHEICFQDHMFSLEKIVTNKHICLFNPTPLFLPDQWASYCRDRLYRDFSLSANILSRPSRRRPKSAPTRAALPCGPPQPHNHNLGPDLSQSTRTTDDTVRNPDSLSISDLNYHTSLPKLLNSARSNKKHSNEWPFYKFLFSISWYRLERCTRWIPPCSHR